MVQTKLISIPTFQHQAFMRSTRHLCLSSSHHSGNELCPVQPPRVKASSCPTAHHESEIRSRGDIVMGDRLRVLQLHVVIHENLLRRRCTIHTIYCPLDVFDARPVADDDFKNPVAGLASSPFAVNRKGYWFLRFQHGATRMLLPNCIIEEVPLVVFNKEPPVHPQSLFRELRVETCPLLGSTRRNISR